MHFLQLLSLVLGLALSAQALIQETNSKSDFKRFSRSLLARRQPKQAEQRDIGDILISDLTTRSSNVANGTTWTESIGFTFADSNSSTNTTCTDSWSASTGNSSAPTKWTPCGTQEEFEDTGELFAWKFTQFDDLSSFVAEYLHIFKRADGTSVEYVTSPLDVALDCKDPSDYQQGCEIQPGMSPLHAYVGMIS